MALFEFKADASTNLIENEPPAAYPVEALGGLREAAAAIAEETQADIVLAAHAVLSVASLAVQPHLDAPTLTGRSQPSSVWFAAAAESGEGKSYTMSIARQPVDDYEKRRKIEQASEVTRFKTNKQLYEVKQKKLIAEVNSKDRERSTAAEADLYALKEPQPPLSYIKNATDPTPEGLFDLFIRSDKSLAILNDEAAIITKGIAAKSENRDRFFATFSKYYEGGPLNFTRRQSDTASIRGIRLTANLTMQPKYLSDLFGDATFFEQGLGNRFLIAYPASRIDYQLYKRPAEATPVAISSYAAMIGQLLDEPIDYDAGEVKPRAVQLDTPAHRALVAVHDEIQFECREGGRYAEIASYAVRMPNHAARLATVLSGIREIQTQSLRTAEVEAGISLGRYYLAEMLRLRRLFAHSKQDQAAQRALDWMRRNYRDDGLAERDIYRGLHLSKSDARPALQHLITNGLVVENAGRFHLSKG